MSGMEFERTFSLAAEYLKKITGVKVSTEKINNALKEAIHIAIHELAHLYIDEALPCLTKLDDKQHTLVDEVLARFLERKTSSELNLLVESFEEQLEELRNYPELKELKWNVESYKELYNSFEGYVKEGKTLKDFAIFELFKRLKIEC